MFAIRLPPHTGAWANSKSIGTAQQPSPANNDQKWAFMLRAHRHFMTSMSLCPSTSQSSRFPGQKHSSEMGGWKRSNAPTSLCSLNLSDVWSNSTWKKQRGNAIQRNSHWSFHQLRSWAADRFTSVKNHSCHPLQWEGPVTTYRLQHVAAHCVWSNRGDSNQQTRQTFPKLGWGPGPPPGRRGRCNAEQRTPSSPSGPFMSSTTCHSAKKELSQNIYIYTLIIACYTSLSEPSSHTIPQIYSNANAIKTNERETRTTDRKVTERNSHRKKNLKHPPRLAGDVLVTYEFLQFATVSFPPFTFKSKAAPPNCASMWVTFSWSSDGSWEPLSNQGKCKSSNIM